MDKLSLFQTSSPSYILMSSIDTCMDIIEDESVFSDWHGNLLEFIKDAKKLKNLKIAVKDNLFYDYDPSKILIFSKDAHRLASRLRDKKIEPEMTAPDYVLCMTGVGDTKESFDILKSALFELDEEFTPYEKTSCLQHIPKTAITVKNAKQSKSEYINESNALGRISAEYIWAYPPGIPLIVPGEVIDQSILSIFSKYKEAGVDLVGGPLHIQNKILVIST